MHEVGSAPWVEAALRAAALLENKVCSDIAEDMRLLISDPGRAMLISVSIGTDVALDPLITMGMGPGLLARIVESSLLILLESFPREKVLAPAWTGPLWGPVGGLRPLVLFPDQEAMARALMEEARVRAAYDLAVGLMVIDPAEFDDMTDEQLERFDPDRPVDPATLDVASVGGTLTEFDVAVMLGERSKSVEFVSVVLDEVLRLHAEQVAALMSDCSGTEDRYPGW